MIKDNNFSQFESERLNFPFAETKLAEKLNINKLQLNQIIEKIELSSCLWTESIHFIYTNKNRQIRSLSKEGMIAIANYFDKNENNEVTNIILEWIEAKNISKIDSEIRNLTYQNNSSLITKNNRHWLNKKDICQILKTSSQRLIQAFEEIKTSDFLLIPEEDFEDINKTRYYSLSGLEKLSLELSTKLSSEKRRKYCERVRIVTPSIIEEITLFLPPPSPKDIEVAMKYVKKRDNGKCQITGKSLKDEYDLELAVHHLFDKKTYSQLADEVDNLITIDHKIHKDFHQYNGGSSKSCTIDDFIEYIDLDYPECHKAILMLLKRKEILNLKLAQSQKALPSYEDDY